MYSAKVMDHFRNPRNTGRLPDADGIGTVGDPGCGDFVCIHIKVRANRLREVTFEICGCPASIAATSMLTVIATGKPLGEAVQITEKQVVDALNGLPAAKVHCSNLGVAALRSAIVDYLQRHRKKILGS